MFATSSKDASAKIYDMLTYEELACYKTDRPLNGVALSPIFDHMVVVGGVEARDVTTTRTQKNGIFVLQLCSEGGDWSSERFIRNYEQCPV